MTPETLFRRTFPVLFSSDLLGSRADSDPLGLIMREQAKHRLNLNSSVQRDPNVIHFREHSCAERSDISRFVPARCLRRPLSIALSIFPGHRIAGFRFTA